MKYNDRVRTKSPHDFYGNVVGAVVDYDIDSIDGSCKYLVAFDSERGERTAWIREEKLVKVEDVE